MIHRRSFLAGLVSSLAAPAIVRAELIMPVRRIIDPHAEMMALLKQRMEYCAAVLQQNIAANLYGTGVVQAYPGGFTIIDDDKWRFTSIGREIKIP